MIDNAAGYVRVLSINRGLIWQLVQRDIVNRTSGNMLGWLWLIAQPALQVVAFWFLLDIVLSVRSNGPIAFMSYFLTAMISWLFISEVLSRSLSVLSEFSGLYQRTLFPIKILPLLPLCLAIIIYSPVFIVVSAINAGIHGGIYALIIIMLLSIWLVPFAYLLAIIGLFIRESRQIFPFFISLLMYFSPILYQPHSLSGNLKIIMQYNPIAGIIACIQHLIYGQDINSLDWVVPALLWLLIVLPSAAIFSRAEPYIREEL